VRSFGSRYGGSEKERTARVAPNFANSGKVSEEITKPGDLFFGPIVEGYLCSPRFVRRDWLAEEIGHRSRFIGIGKLVNR
jgi:hypothetical protein